MQHMRSDGVVERAVRAATRPQGLDIKVPVQVVTVRPVRDEPVRVHKNSPGDLTLGQATARAVAFLVVLTTLGGLLLTVAVMFLVNSLTAAGVMRALGVGGILLLLAGLTLNRTNHAGACPGVVAHCRGCKR